MVAYPPTDHFGGPISETEITDRAKQTPFRILFLGNVIERKGLHTLLEACQKFDVQNPRGRCRWLYDRRTHVSV